MGIKPELLIEKLTRANEGLRLVMMVEQRASKVEELSDKANAVKTV